MHLNSIPVILSLAFALLAQNSPIEFWGFFGHRLINKTAVFTLPVDLVPLFKSNIDFITEHSIDPDKRRYAAPLEAVRHYIDLDAWGVYPFENIPWNLPEAMAAFSTVYVVNEESRDTAQSWKNDEIWESVLSDYQKNRVIQDLTQRLIEIQEVGWITLPDNWLPDGYDPVNYDLIFTQQFSDEGILPYHLSMYQARLTKAFKDKDWALVIKLSTEMGHYISDAHVPLHTTRNYNGQLTGQDGIHAFWESRIPELFATEQYDFFVGRAMYIEDTDSYFWNIVLNSHTHVAEVLSKELEVREEFAKDRQFCFTERGGVTARFECREYAAAYQDAMAGMVEKQMRKSIHAVGSVWYTAWVNAGRPEIDIKDPVKLDSITVLRSGGSELQDKN